MRTTTLAARIVAVLLAGALAACSGGNDQGLERVDPDETGGGLTTDQPTRIGDLFGQEDDEDGSSGGDLAVNKYIWRASLDTLAFLPIASTDPFSGVIATDWGAVDGATAERFKVTAYVTDVKLEARSLRVAIFRQVRQDEGWVSAGVNPTTARQIENSILTRARQLKIADLDAEG